MAYSHITVFGGSGFLGRQIVKRLAADGARVRVAVRHPERASFLAEYNTAGPISAIRADVWGGVGRRGGGRLRSRHQHGRPLRRAEQGNV